MKILDGVYDVLTYAVLFVRTLVRSLVGWLLSVLVRLCWRGSLVTSLGGFMVFDSRLDLGREYTNASDNRRIWQPFPPPAEATTAAIAIRTADDFFDRQIVETLAVRSGTSSENPSPAWNHRVNGERGRRAGRRGSHECSRGRSRTSLPRSEDWGFGTSTPAQAGRDGYTLLFFVLFSEAAVDKCLVSYSMGHGEETSSS